MRKYLTFSLVGIFLLSILASLVSFAQNKESSVVKDDWVYQDMNVLSQAGLLVNYPFEWVKTGKKLCRIEFAYYIKHLIMESLKEVNFKKRLSETTTVALQRLLKEFQLELYNLGIKTTDIAQINLSPSDFKADNDGYVDLDQLLSSEKPNQQEPYYYFGEYYNNLMQKTFLFIPTIHIRPNDLKLFEGKSTEPKIVYQPEIDKSISFLVVKGNLPLEDIYIDGYYLFPFKEDFWNPKDDSNQKIMGLLDEVNQIKQVDHLWRLNGILGLEGFLQLTNDFSVKVNLEQLEQGIKIGGLLVYSDSSTNKIGLEPSQFGLPNDKTTKPMDLDKLTPKNIKALQINIHGALPLTPQASLYGGFDLLYRDLEVPLETFWPSDTKASAALFYQLNDYWTLSTYQSLVNFHQKDNLLSTTSLGVNYHDWVTLWLAYQLVSFKDPVLSGTLSIHF